MKNPSKAKRIMYSAFAALGVTAGAAGLASAATNQPAPTTTEAGQSQDGANETETDVKSSVTVDDTAEAANEEQENADLQKLAKISADDAAKAATSAVPGTAGTPQLENDNGNVVYEVEVTATDGTVTEVKVDPGTGDVLAQEIDDDSDEADDDNEANEGSEANEGAETAPDATPAPSK